MINKRVSPHYENLLAMALSAAVDELCELYLNQAKGMVEAVYLMREMSDAAFKRETQRIQQVRVTRMGRAVAA